MKTFRLPVFFVALSSLTVLYGWFIWLGIGAYLAVLPAGAFDHLPMMTQVVVQASLPYPWHAVTMQAVGFLSLGLSLIWGTNRLKRGADADSLSLPAICHIGVIVFCLCAIGVGLLLPLVGVAAVL